MTDPVERSLERFAPPGPGDELRDRVLLAVEAELSVRRGYRWDRVLAAAALVLALSGGALIWRANMRHEREMARLLGPQPVPQEIVELQAMIASVTNEATAARCAESLCKPTRVSAESAPMSVCSLAREGGSPNFH